jgi:hypothetical protein
MSCKVNSDGKKKKKPLDPSLWPFALSPIPINSVVTPRPIAPPGITEEMVDDLIKTVPDYMPLWKAWLLYSAYTAGLPLGHETMGAALGAKIAKNVGVRAFIGGGVGYLAAIVVVGGLATILDPLDYYEGGLNLTPAEIKQAGQLGSTTFANELVNPSPTIRGRLNPLGIRTGWQ